MTCHTHNYPKYTEGKKAHQDANTEISSRI